MPYLRRLRTQDLTSPEVRAIRDLLDVAFGADEDERFTEDDWQHALGGLHFVLDVDGEILVHAAVVARMLHVGGVPLRTGYVEAVATAPSRQRSGLGTVVMREVGRHIAEVFELGALGTGTHRFYERLGWVTWGGPSSVRAPEGERRTPDDDRSSWCCARRPRPPSTSPPRSAATGVTATSGRKVAGITMMLEQVQ